MSGIENLSEERSRSTVFIAIDCLFAVENWMVFGWENINNAKIYYFSKKAAAV
jgi:hypothetical protein